MSVSLEAIKKPIEKELNAFEVMFKQSMKTRVPLLDIVLNYILKRKGKQIRPLFVMYTAKLFGDINIRTYRGASLVELLHTATLVHDDVVDESTLRRGRPTANESFGNPASVLVGDFLYSRAFQMMVDANDMRVMEILSQATNVIAEGEVMQLMNMHDASLDEAGYLRVIRSKTAKLFEASTRLAAVLAQSSAATETACADYGQALGTAFQVIDDVLDYDGDATLMGKNLGDDLREGKATLPLIVAMQRGNDAERTLIATAIEQGDVTALGRIADIVRQTGAMQATREAASAQAQQAIDALQPLPEGDHKSALYTLAEQLLARQR